MPGNYDCQVPKTIERYLATLSKLYARTQKNELQKIIVNAKVRVHEAYSVDNWNGGTYGHALFLAIPEDLFPASPEDRKELGTQICKDIDNLINQPNEFIEEVFLELAVLDDEDWRQNSGALLSGHAKVAESAQNRIWDIGHYRVFLSHKSEFKKEASVLRDKLRIYGVSAFVAHEDIHPTEAWQDEIENALKSMDALVALVTEDFHDSSWTDQEVGFALGRGVPAIALRLGCDPYGFIGRFQALSCKDDTELPLKLMELLTKEDSALDAYIAKMQVCENWENANKLAELLPFIRQCSDQHVDAFRSAFSANQEIWKSWGFNGTRPMNYGEGLANHLSRITGRHFMISGNEVIEMTV